MATQLAREVIRETTAKVSNRCLIVGLVPGNLISIREKGTHKTWYLPIEAAFSVAVKMELAAEKREKAKAKKK